MTKPEARILTNKTDEKSTPDRVEKPFFPASVESTDCVRLFIRRRSLSRSRRFLKSLAINFSFSSSFSHVVSWNTKRSSFQWLNCFFHPLNSDQSSVQNICYDNCQEESYECQQGVQYCDNQSCNNCEEYSQCPPQCTQCPPPSRFTETRQCEAPNENFAVQRSQSRQDCYEQQDTQSTQDCYQQQSYQDCEPCYAQSKPCSDPCQSQYDPCPLRCDPCEPCEPAMTCDDFNCPPFDPMNPKCSPFRRYRQPPRRESCKPIICYQRPTLPMAADTIYKKSFPCIDSCTAASCRLPLVRPVGQLRALCGEFAKATIAKVIWRKFSWRSALTWIRFSVVVPAILLSRSSEANFAEISQSDGPGTDARSHDTKARFRPQIPVQTPAVSPAQ